MLRCLVLPTLFVTSIGIAGGAEPPKVVERWALLVGVDDYANANKLSYCGADQAALHKRLLAAGFPEDHVFLLHDTAAENRYRPSKGNIEKQLGIVLNLADKDDLLLIAFSGHGVSLDGRSYLCPNDAALADPATMVSVDGVYDRLKECAAGFKLVLVDACRNDPRPGGVRALGATSGTRALARALQEMKLPEGVVLLNSCAPGEVSWEDEQFGHGVFMHFVLDGLGGAADANSDASVSLNELQNFAGTRTKTHVARRFNESQRPFFKGDLTTEALEYALLPVTPGSGPAPPPAITPFDAATAKAHQTAWAKHLGKDVEFTNSLGMKFRLIPPGEFMMGADEDALSVLRRFNYLGAGEISDAYPLHRVRLTKPCYLGMHEVTLGQFLQFYHDAKYKMECERDGLGGSGWTGVRLEQRRSFVPWDWGFKDQTMFHPLVNVTWNDAVTFCDWLSRMEGKIYRLPAEAEWEYACKAGTTTRYSFGNDPEELTSYGNGADRTLQVSFDSSSLRRHAKWENGTWTVTTIPLPFLQANDGRAFTSQVGSFQPNAFGLCDMHGNVWEWCSDWYGETYYRESAASDPGGPSRGFNRVIRGGSWDYSPVHCTSAYRGGDAPTSRFANQGFRIVLEP